MRFISLLPLVLLAACATSTPQKAQQAPQTKAPAAVVSAGSAASKSEFATISEANLARAQAAGYKVVDENGHKLYCRRSLVTGTRLRYQTDCVTEAEFLQLSTNTKEIMNRPLYNNPPPGG
jgi:hypothetical protein